MKSKTQLMKLLVLLHLSAFLLASPTMITNAQIDTSNPQPTTTALLWHPNGALIAIASYDYYDGSDYGNSRVIVVNTATNQVQITLVQDSSLYSRIFSGLAWGSNGNQLFVGDTEGRIVLYDVATGNQVRTYQHSSNLLSNISVNPLGTQLASSSLSGEINIFDIDSGSIVHTFNLQNQIGSGAIKWIDWSPIGDKFAAVSANNVVHIWDAVTFIELLRLQQGGAITQLNVGAWNSDGTLIAVGGRDRFVTVWNVTNGQSVLVSPNLGSEILSLSWHPFYTQFAIGLNRIGENVQIWDTTTNNAIETVTTEFEMASTLAWGSDVRLAVGGTVSENAAEPNTEGVISVFAPSSPLIPTSSPTPTTTSTLTASSTTTPNATDTPTATPTATPSLTPTPPATSTLRIEAESYTSAASGVTFGGTGDEGGGEAVYDFDSGRWIAFNNIDLLGGVITFRLRADSPASGNLSLRLGSATASPFCTLAWTDSGGDYATRETSCSVPVSGVNTLYLTNDSVPFINVNWLEIDRSTGGGAPTYTPSPTLSPTPTPDTTTLRIEAETYTSAASGVYFGGTDDEGGGEAVYDFDLGRWIAFANVDLQGGVVTFRYRGDSAGGGDISLRIGSATATPFCTLAWTPGGTYYTTRETTCSTPVSGVVTLYVTNDSVPWINTNWLELVAP
jgi:WD40 repeat protein